MKNKVKRLFKGTVGKNILFSFIYEATAIVTGLIVPRLIIEAYGSEVNGLVNTITQYLGFISLLNLGFGPVVKSILYRPLYNNDQQKIANIIGAATRFFRNISYCFIAYIIFLCLFSNFLMPASFDLWYTISLIVIISISTFFEYFISLSRSLLLEADKKSYIIHITHIVSLILNTIFTIVLIRYGQSVHLVKFIGGLCYIIRPLFYLYYVKKHYNLDLKNINKAYEIKNKNAALAQHISGIVHGKTDTIVLSMTMGQKMVSVYSVYYLVINGIQSLVTTIVSSLSGNFGSLLAEGNQKKIKNIFSVYEVLIYYFTTLLYSVTSLLIIPFVSLYIDGAQDVNYIEPIFASIIVLSFFVLALKTPYNSLANIAGLFKETRRGAIIEAGLNLGISLILVFPLGLVGIAIGTLISVMYRFIDLIIICSKKVLQRNYAESVKPIIASAICYLIIASMSFIFNIQCANWAEFIIYGIIFTIVCAAFIAIVYFVFFKRDIKIILKKVRGKTR